MALCDFYAVKRDLVALLDFLFTTTDIVAFESYSAIGKEPLQFRSSNDIAGAFDVGGSTIHLQLWSAAVMCTPEINRIDLKEPAGAYRYCVEGIGLMQIYLGGIRSGVIHHTHFGHWNEAGARSKSRYPADQCDWRALTKVSRTIQGFVRKSAVGKLLSRPILPEAYKAVVEAAAIEFNSELYRADAGQIKLTR